MNDDQPETGVGVVAAIRPAPLPRGTFFELGWVMAQLFDSRRFEPLSTRGLDPSIQLPMISELDLPERRRLAVTELIELTSSERLPMDIARQVLASANAAPFDGDDFQDKIRSMHLAILDRSVDDLVRLNSYHLGIALSDLCWKHSPSGDWVNTLVAAFTRGEVIQLQVLLRAASNELPDLAAATVSKSLEKWQDWVIINTRILLANYGNNQPPNVPSPVLRTLRIQGDIWHQLLTIETSDEDIAGPSPAAITIFRRLWPILILIVSALASIMLYWTITNFNGSAKAWTTIGTITTVLGVTGASLVSAARRTVNAFGWNQRTTTSAEARVWSVTVLPAIGHISRRRPRSSMGQGQRSVQPSSAAQTDQLWHVYAGHGG